MTVELHTTTPSATRRIGERIGRMLRPGDVVLLSGELGTGKTVLAQGIGRGLGIRDPIKSSSFIIMNEYQGPQLRMYHADLYRLEDPQQVAELALDELAANGVLVVEWPERAPAEVPSEHLRIELAYEGAKGRVLGIEARSERYAPLLRRLAREVTERPGNADRRSHRSTG
jgi:tRNA threonylcarbamoyladenosine biosynthesis protein TsaE